MACHLRLSPLEEALLFYIRAERSPVSRARIDAFISRGALDWQALWVESARHQVLPLVAQALSDPREVTSAPEEVRETAKRVRLQTLLSNTILHTELRRLGRLLATHGIAATPLKGTHLTERLYVGLDARSCGDIDLLVSRADFAATDTLLRADGYTPEPVPSPGVAEHPFHGIPLVRQRGSTTTVVELHWKLTDPRFVSVDYRALWERIPAADNQASGLCPLPSEELLVFLAMHLPKHHNGILRLLADIDRLARREAQTLDWEGLLALARRWDAEYLLYFALQQAQQLFDTPFPPTLTRALQPPRWRRGAIDLLAGARTALRPPAGEYLRYNRSCLAYATMLTPVGRTLDASRHYLFPPTRSNTPTAAASRVARGTAWAALAVASAVLPWPRAGTK